MNVPTKILFSLFAITLIGTINADHHSSDEQFGPYVALVRNKEIVKDVKVEENGRIYLLLNPEYKEKEIILKNSSGNKTGYRKWFNGEYELVSAANQGKAANEYTDWVVTSGNYVEYYLEGSLILHLKKANL